MNLEEIYEEKQLKYNKGFLSESEYLNSKILYEKSKSEVLGLQLELKNQINGFKLVLGLPGTQEIFFGGDLEKHLSSYLKYFTDEKKTELCDFSKDKNLSEVKILLLQKSSLEKELQIKKLEAYGPDFNIFYQAGQFLVQEMLE